MCENDERSLEIKNQGYSDGFTIKSFQLKPCASEAQYEKILKLRNTNESFRLKKRISYQCPSRPIQNIIRKFR